MVFIHTPVHGIPNCMPKREVTLRSPTIPRCRILLQHPRGAAVRSVLLPGTVCFLLFVLNLNYQHCMSSRLTVRLFVYALSLRIRIIESMCLAGRNKVTDIDHNTTDCAITHHTIQVDTRVCCYVAPTPNHHHHTHTHTHTNKPPKGNTLPG